MLLTIRFPVIEAEGSTVAVAVGKPTVEFGDEVILDARFDTNLLPTLYVAGVDTAPATEVAPEVLALFGLASVEHFVEALSRVYGTGLPADVTVTFYTLYDRPVETL